MSSARAHLPQAPTSTAPLLYWLLVICGLGGLTMQRLDAPRDVLPLWAGTIVGLGLGQLVAWARIRLWVLWALGMVAFWLSPLLMIVFYGPFSEAGDSVATTSLYAAVPAAICGYLALSERGALLAFWYPAVLWMLVILDGPSATTFDTHAALPLVIGLTALFVAYLRARETRRVALWRTQATVRLATPVSHSVLRASPLRAASQHLWTAVAGAGALVLAAWIAPHLWQTEKTKHTSHASAASTSHDADDARTAWTIAGPHCCSQAEMLETKRVRVREYFPLVHGNDENHGFSSASSASPSCTVCQDGDTGLASSASDYEGFGRGGGSGTSTDMSPPPYGYGGGSPSSYGAGYGAGSGSSTPIPSTPSPTPATVTPTTPSTAVAPVPPAPVPVPVAAAPHAPTPTTPAHPSGAEPTAGVTASKTTYGRGAAPAVVVLEPGAAAAPGMSAPPWETVLFASVGALGLRALFRAVRRKVRLRHLARPFWPETLDQRISNHWERVLIALRDAGIHASDDEQPEALAKRVGIEGMETCATILERVRHGVRVDADDLAAMDVAADAVVRAAEQRSGLAGRAVALVRPLA